MRFRRQCLSIILLLALPLQFASAQTYPTKPIHLVVPFPPGGPSDVVTRLIGQRWTEALGQPVVVDNRAGASGAIGSEFVARAQPDGYTLILSTASTLGSTPLVNKVNWDPIKDFTSIGLLCSEPMALVVHPSLPVKTVSELIALAKAKPGKLNVASFGTGSIAHLALELLNFMADIKMTHVPYKGAAAAMTDLIGGQVDAMFVSVSVVVPSAKAGKLRLIAVASSKRSGSVPDVPTIAESGLKGYAAETWYSISGPARLPEEIVARLSNEVVRALKTPEVRERLIALGSEPRGGTAAELDAVLKSDVAKWKKIVEFAKIKPE